VAGPFADNELCQDFVRNVAKMLDLKEWRPKDLAAACTYAYTTVANIMSFNREPSVPNGQAFDSAFGVTMFEGKAEAIHRQVFPAGFGKFAAYEETAVSLHVFGHSLVPGLVQTEDYAREILSTRPDKSPAEVERLVAARMGRQDILTRGEPAPPLLWVLVDESVLERPVAPPPVMYRQCMRLVEVSEMPNVRLGVVPYRAAGHSGLLGAFVIAKQADGSVMVHVEDVTGGRPTNDIVEVREVTLTFETLQMECLPVGDSRELIARKAEEVWKPLAPAGARALTAGTTAVSA
jgi:hypothetical protein